MGRLLFPALWIEREVYLSTGRDWLVLDLPRGPWFDFGMHLFRMKQRVNVGGWLGLFVFFFTTCTCQSNPEQPASRAENGSAMYSAEAVSRQRDKQSEEEKSPSHVRELKWFFDDTPLGPMGVEVTVPKQASSKNPLPVLIALHGQGESRKTPETGARGWPYDYGMIHAMKRLRGVPLTADDFGGMVSARRLSVLNKSLSTRPYRGIIVVSPYLPDRFTEKKLLQDARDYGRFLTQTLLPKVYAETPAMGTVASTGIDGVSLGGRASILVGLTHSAYFGAVGGTQAAFSVEQTRLLVPMVQQARSESPHLRFRILSSKKDRFRKMTETFSSLLHQKRQPHQIDIVEGNHSYEFNRGPGVYEMLIYYDRVLRQEVFL